VGSIIVAATTRSSHYCRKHRDDFGSATHDATYTNCVNSLAASAQAYQTHATSGNFSAAAMSQPTRAAAADPDGRTAPADAPGGLTAPAHVAATTLS
jgi:hypothetical protein